MVQLGVTENPKEKALMKPTVPVDSTVVVLQPTTPPTAKRSCCTRRVVISLSVTCILLAMTIAGVLLALYVRRDLCYTYWGACGHYYGDDVSYHEYESSEFPMWNEVELGQSSSFGSSGSLTILEEYIVEEKWQDGDGEDYPHADPSYEHVPGNPGEHVNFPPNSPPELTRRRRSKPHRG